jgi:hypothetical protein
MVLFRGRFRQTPGANKWNTWPEFFWKHGFYAAGYEFTTSSHALWRPRGKTIDSVAAATHLIADFRFMA